MPLLAAAVALAFAWLGWTSLSPIAAGNGRQAPRV
jgi:hypothetical protein